MARQIVIRLQRNRVFKKPQYRVVAIFKDTKMRGAPLDILGVYNPMTPYKMFFINIERLAFWAHKGAIVSDSVVKLVGLFFSALFKTKEYSIKKKSIKSPKSIKKMVVKKTSISSSKKQLTSLVKNKTDYNMHLKFAKRFWVRNNLMSIINNRQTSFYKQ